MLWVTRPKCHIDRTASAWLIRRFVDPSATFAFAPDKETAAALQGTPFDMRGVELGHHDGRCSFESILLNTGWMTRHCGAWPTWCTRSMWMMTGFTPRRPPA